MYLWQIKRDYHGWMIMVTSSEFALFSLASGPLNPKPTTGYDWSYSSCSSNFGYRDSQKSAR